MLGLPPAFMLSLINKALDTAPSQWARSERRVSHAADHISSWRSCSKTKTNGRLRTLERCCCWFFWRAFFQVPTFVFSLEKTKRYMDFILDLHKMLWKNKYSKWWWIHLIYRRILWKKFKKSRLFFALFFFWRGGECFFNNFSSEKAEPRGSQAGRSTLPLKQHTNLHLDTSDLEHTSVFCHQRLYSTSAAVNTWLVVGWLVVQPLVFHQIRGGDPRPSLNFLGGKSQQKTCRIHCDNENTPKKTLKDGKKTPWNSQKKSVKLGLLPPKGIVIFQPFIFRGELLVSKSEDFFMSEIFREFIGRSRGQEETKTRWKNTSESKDGYMDVSLNGGTPFFGNTHIGL